MAETNTHSQEEAAKIVDIIGDIRTNGDYQRAENLVGSGKSEDKEGTQQELLDQITDQLDIVREVKEYRKKKGLGRMKKQERHNLRKNNFNTLISLIENAKSEGIKVDQIKQEAEHHIKALFLEWTPRSRQFEGVGSLFDAVLFTKLVEILEVDQQFIGNEETKEQIETMADAFGRMIYEWNYDWRNISVPPVANVANTDLKILKYHRETNRFDIPMDIEIPISDIVQATKCFISLAPETKVKFGQTLSESIEHLQRKSYGAYFTQDEKRDDFMMRSLDEMRQSEVIIKIAHDTGLPLKSPLGDANIVMQRKKDDLRRLHGSNTWYKYLREGAKLGAEGWVTQEEFSKHKTVYTGSRKVALDVLSLNAIYIAKNGLENGFTREINIFDKYVGYVTKVVEVFDYSLDNIIDYCLNLDIEGVDNRELLSIVEKQAELLDVNDLVKEAIDNRIKAKILADIEADKVWHLSTEDDNEEQVLKGSENEEVLVKLDLTHEFPESLKKRAQAALADNFITLPEVQEAATNLWHSHIEAKETWGMKDLIEKEHKKAAQVANEFGLGDDLLNRYYDKCLEKCDWINFHVLGTHYDNFRQKYRDYIKSQEKIAQNPELSFQQRKPAIDTLTGLAQVGDSEVVKRLSEFILEGQKNEDATLGLDPVAEAAYFSLLKLDNADTNNTLWGLVLNPDTSPYLKQATLKRMIGTSHSFLSPDRKKSLNAWYSAQEKKINLNWNDLDFLTAINRDIPSKTTRLHSNLLADRCITKLISPNRLSITEAHQQYENIPKNSFLQIYEVTNGDSVTLANLNAAYNILRKNNRMRENLLYGFVNVGLANQKIRQILQSTLAENQLSQMEDVSALANVMRRLNFLNSLDEFITIEPDVYTEFQNLGLSELENQLEEFTLQKIREVLPNEEITTEKIGKIIEQWDGNIEPILTYLGRYPELKDHIAEIVAHIDSDENWKAWRYDIGNLKVKEQIGNFSERQRGIWQQDYVAELGDMEVSQESADKPAAIYATLQNAIHNYHHIYDPEHGYTEHGFIQNQMDEIYAAIEASPTKREKIITNASGKILQDYTNLAEYLSIQQDINAVRKIPNLLQKWQINERRKAKVREKHEIIDIEAAQSELTGLQDQVGQYEEVIEQYKQGIKPLRQEYARKINDDQKNQQTLQTEREQKEKELGEDLIGPNYTTILEQHKRMKLLEDAMPEPLKPEVQATLKKVGLSNDASDKDIQKTQNTLLQQQTELKEGVAFKKYGLDPNSRNLKLFYDRLSEMDAVARLLKLSNLSIKQITQNRFEEDKKAGPTVFNTIIELQKYFKDTALRMDLKNIEALLAKESEMYVKRRLGVIITDDPRVMWQVGKYPIGNGSCQNYAEGTHAQNLMGYVGDANCKVGYLFDINHLNEEIQELINKQGLAAVYDQIPTDDLLNATMARRVIKTGTAGAGGSPIVVLEPTYTTANKDDHAMDNVFEIAIHQLLAGPMGVDIARERRKGDKKDDRVSVDIGWSRSPGGQYEDLNLYDLSIVQGLPKIAIKDAEMKRGVAQYKKAEPEYRPEDAISESDGYGLEPKEKYDIKDLLSKYRSSREKEEEERKQKRNPHRTPQDEILKRTLDKYL